MKDCKTIITENKYLIGILTLVFVIRLLPAFLFPTLPGLDVYYHKTLVEAFLGGSLGLSNVLSISGLLSGSYPLFFHFLLSLFAGIGLTTLFKIAPAIFGVILVYVYYLFGKELTTEKIALLATFLLSTAPILVLRTSQTIPEILGLIFFTASLLYLVKLQKDFKLSYIIMLIALFGLYFITHRSILFLFILLPVLILTLYRDHLKVILAALAIFFGAGYLLGFVQPALEQLSRLAWEPVTAKGFLLSPGLMIVPAAIGVVLLYNRLERKDQFLLGWTLLFGFLGIMSFRFRDPFMMFPLAIMASYGIYNHFQPKLGANFKKIFILFAILLIIQSVAVVSLAVPHPAEDEYTALTWIKENTPEEAVVLSWVEPGYWINGVAERKDVIIWNRLYEGVYGDQPSVDETEKTYKDVIRMFRSSNETYSKELMETYKVTHVFIDSKMAEELDAVEFGLLEYIDSSPDFGKIYGINNVSVYEVVNEA